MVSSSKLRILCIFSVAAVFCSSAPAQAPPKPQPPPQEPFRLKVAVDVVNVDVTVTDGKGNFVRGLTRENFRVLDDGVEAPLANFASIEAPAIVMLLVETSPAVFLIHRQHIAASGALLAGLAPGDWAGLVTYADSLQVIQPLTSDKGAVQAALRSSRFGLGSAQLNLFESVSAALDLLTPVAGKKTMVLISTGLDTSASDKWNALLQKLRTSETTVYAIALGGDLRDYRPETATAAGEEANPLSFAEADRVLKEMAATTGGAAFFPRKNADLQAIYRQVATTIRHRYSLAFSPPTRDGKFHRIFVQLLDGKGKVLGPEYSAGPAGEAGKEGKKVQYGLMFRQGYVATLPE